MTTQGNSINDPQRLAALRASGLLDTPAEAMFDRLTQVAAAALRVPVALISLVDEDRQFFKSQCGLPEPVASARQTPLSHSFCRHVVIGNDALLIADAREHPLVRDNPSIKDLGVIAYAGVPIMEDGGHVLGSMCAIDNKPREWSAHDMEVLKALSAQVSAAVALRAQSFALAADLARQRDHEADRRTLSRLNIHDLRTPLSALLLGLDMIKLLGDINEEQASYLSVCKRNGQALVDMINTLLEIDIIEHRGAAALKLAALQPATVIASAIEQIRALAQEKAIELTTEVPTALPQIWADAHSMERVLVNLLGNAIKFTNAGGKMRLRAQMVAGSPTEFIEFSISDTGIGMADASRIFDEGVRLDANAVPRRSTGLGLTYCKRMVEAHGGQIRVESQLAVGSTFTISIPIVGADAGSSNKNQ